MQTPRRWSGSRAPSSLERFLRVQLGDETHVPEREARLIKKPSRWARDDGLAYLEREVPLTQWPPFLAARAEWLVSCLRFGTPDKLQPPEVRAFDFERELPWVERLEPLALYWCLRAFSLDEREVFDAAAPLARKVSPLASSLADLVEERWSGANSESGLVRTREALRQRRKDVPITAAWPRGLDPALLVPPGGR